MHTSLRRSSRTLSAVSSIPHISQSRSSSTATAQPAASGPRDSTDASPTTRPATKRPRSASTSELSDLPESDAAPSKPRKKPRLPKATEYRVEDYPARAESLWKIGPHVSAAGGVENAVLNAASIGATAFALFLKSQRKWSAPPLTQVSIDAFKTRLRDFSYDCKHVMPHGNYLVNLGNPDAEKREKSYQCFVDELKRCEQLGLTLFNFHPGSTVGQASPAESLAHIAQGINRAHEETNSVVVVIENMAGAGNVLGSRFEEIGTIIGLVKNKERVGVCLDTCHMFAAGYDIRTRESWDKAMKAFDDTIGLKYLRGMHLNDSKTVLSSQKDRHENIGQGHIGLAGFSHILNDPRTQDIPLILETPAHDDGKTKWTPGRGWDVWRKEVEVLHQVAGGRDGATEKEWDERLEGWTNEISGVVKTVGDDGPATKSSARAKEKGKSAKKAKAKKQEDGDGEDSCRSCA